MSEIKLSSDAPATPGAVQSVAPATPKQVKRKEKITNIEWTNENVAKHLIKNQYHTLIHLSSVELASVIDEASKHIKNKLEAEAKERQEAEDKAKEILAKYVK
jgi:hypothetical protein